MSQSQSSLLAISNRVELGLVGLSRSKIGLDEGRLDSNELKFGFISKFYIIHTNELNFWVQPSWSKIWSTQVQRQRTDWSCFGLVEFIWGHYYSPAFSRENFPIFKYFFSKIFQKYLARQNTKERQLENTSSKNISSYYVMQREWGTSFVTKFRF